MASSEEQRGATNLLAVLCPPLLLRTETNKKLWNEYAKNYAQQQQKAAAASSAASASASVASVPSEWVLDMASAVHRDAAQLEFLGDEWSDDASLTQSLNQFLLPYLGVNSLSEEEWAEAKQTEDRIRAEGAGVSHLPPSHLQSWIAEASSGSSGAGLVVAELGVGGGRIASRVYTHVQRLYCFDIATEMLEQAQASISRQWRRQQAAAAAAAAATAANSDGPAAVPPTDSAAATLAVSAPAPASAGVLSLPPHLSLHLLAAAPAFPSKYHGTCDLVYCFDVMPHIDLHTIHGYFESIRRMLKPNPPAEERSARRPRVFLHTANLCAPLGWDRFSKQTRYTAGGFYFLSPDIVRQLATQHGYRIIQESKWTSAYVAPKATADSAAALPRESNLYYQRDYLFVMERK